MELCGEDSTWEDEVLQAPALGWVLARVVALGWDGALEVSRSVQCMSPSDTVLPFFESFIECYSIQ